MLQALREKTSGLIAKIILGAIVIAFSFFGIESYFIGRTDDFVARVGDQEISQQEFRARFDEFRQREMQRSGGRLDASYFEQPELKRQLLDSLIREKVVLAANDTFGVVVPADRLRSEILQIPAFQRDGRFDEDQYRAVLSSQGMTPVSFADRVSKDMASREMPLQIASSEFVTGAEVDAYLRLREQSRDFRTLTLAKPVLADVNVSDDEIDTYYADHQQEFMHPEQVALEYLELDASKLDVKLTPDDVSLKERYEKEKARFVSTEQRLASHILIKVAGKGGPEEQKQALEKAQKIAGEAKAGTDFADLAKQSSDDLGSKALGGDLGWLDKGMTDPAFESALYALDKAQISDPVLSPEGYHVIDLRDIRPGKTRSFDEVRTELLKEYNESERERVYNEKSGRLIDLTYQDASSLEPAARELGIEIQKTPLFTRDGGLGLAANPNVLRSAFSDQVLVQGNNSDAIDLGSNHVAIARIAEHKPAVPRPLDEVRADIKTRILASRTSTQAKLRADELFARLLKGDSLDAIGSELKLAVKDEKAVGRNAVNVDSALLGAVFSMNRPADGMPAYKLVTLAGDAYALVGLDKVTEGDPSKLDAPTREAARNSLQQSASYQSATDFVQALRATMKITIVEERM